MNETRAVVLAIWGAEAAAQLAPVDKLAMRFGFWMWDFDREPLAFFLALAGVLAMIAAPIGLLLQRRALLRAAVVRAGFQREQRAAQK